MRAWATLGVLVACGLGCSDGGARKREPTAPVPPPPRFRSGPPGGPEPELPPGPYRQWLRDVGDELREPWRTFVETASGQLPPGHALNRAELDAVVAIELSVRGERLGAAIGKSSGVPEFDEAALEIVESLAHWPSPPAAAVSDDGKVHLKWRFRRDARRAAPAGAEVEVREFDVATAARMFIKAGRLRDATERLDRAWASGAAGADSGPGLAASRAIATAILVGRVEALAAGARCAGEGCAAAQDLFMVAGAVRALGEGGASDAAGAIERLLASGPPAVRGFAVEALGRLKVASAKGKLLTLLVDPTLAPAAARALAQLGAGTEALLALVGQLAKPTPALVQAVGATEARGALAELLGQAKRGGAGLRVAAWEALGAGAYAPADGAVEVLKALALALQDGDARVRAAALGAVQRWSAAGKPPKGALNAVIGLLGDKDAVVRAAAVRALMEVGSAKWLGELSRAAKDKSPAVTRALAHALGEHPGRVADGVVWLKKLATAADEGTRAEAAAALVLAGEQPLESALAADPATRRAVLAALLAAETAGRVPAGVNPAAAAAALGDAEDEVAALALEVVARSPGRLQAGRTLTSVIMEGASDPAPLAAAWLRATR